MVGWWLLRWPANQTSRRDHESNDRVDATPSPSPHLDTFPRGERGRGQWRTSKGCFRLCRLVCARRSLIRRRFGPRYGISRTRSSCLRNGWTVISRSCRIGWGICSVCFVVWGRVMGRSRGADDGAVCESCADFSCRGVDWYCVAATRRC